MPPWTVETTVAALRGVSHHVLTSMADKQCFIPSLQHHTTLKNIEMACNVLRRYAVVPVPHVRAKGFTSSREACEHIDVLMNVAGVQDVFLVSGDDEKPHGPFVDTMALLRDVDVAARLRQMRSVGFPIYPHEPQRISNAIQAYKSGILPVDPSQVFLITQILWSWSEIEAQWLHAIRDHKDTALFRIGLGICGPVKPSRLHALRNVRGPLKDAIPSDILRYDPAALIAQLPQHDHTFIHLFGFGSLHENVEMARKLLY